MDTTGLYLLPYPHSSSLVSSSLSLVILFCVLGRGVGGVGGWWWVFSDCSWGWPGVHCRSWSLHTQAATPPHCTPINNKLHPTTPEVHSTQLVARSSRYTPPATYPHPHPPHRQPPTWLRPFLLWLHTEWQLLHRKPTAALYHPLLVVVL